MRLNFQQIISYCLGLRTQNPGLREVDLETSPKRGSDKINMQKHGRNTQKKASRIVQPGLTYGSQHFFYPIKESESFNYKTKLVGKLLTTVNNRAELEDIKIVVPLKQLSRFIFSLDVLLINAEIELILKWSQNCVLTEKVYRDAVAKGDDPATEPAINAINTPSDLKFNITDCKLYVPVVTLQTEYQNKLYEKLQTVITIDFTWN